MIIPAHHGQARAVVQQLAQCWGGHPHAGVVTVVDPAWPLAGLEAALRTRHATEPSMPGTGEPPPALVTHSSGSTGRPRGIYRSLDSWRESLASFDVVTGLDRLPSGPWWVPGPLWGSMSLYAVYHALCAGREVIVAGEDPSQAVAVHCVPSLLPDVVARVRAGRLPRLQTAVVAGDRLPTAWWQAAAEVGLRVVEYYGTVELAACAARLAPGAPLRAFPDVALDVRDGELWVHTPYRASGYLEPERGGPLRMDADGWATVGDRACWSGPAPCGLTGGIEVLGRDGDAVTVGGHTVPTGEIEDALRALAGVADAAVVGMPHRLLGHQVGALVVSQAPLAQVRDAARDQLSGPARPRRWVSAPSVPRTAAGKVDRAAVLALLEAQ